MQGITGKQTMHAAEALSEMRAAEVKLSTAKRDLDFMVIPLDSG